MIGAGLPLFQRLKLLRQKELEQERKEALLKQQQMPIECVPQQQQQQQQQQESKPTPSTTTEVTVEVVPKSPPPPPPLPPTEPKPSRHISFVEKPNEISPAKIEKPLTVNRWALTVALPGRASGSSAKFANRRVLDTVPSAEEHPPPGAMEPPPPPPPLPPTPTPPSAPPIWQQPPTPPLLPSAANRGRKKPPRRAMTLRAESDNHPAAPPPSITSARMPFTTAMSQYLRPWHPRPGNSEQLQRTAAAAISRQNTIQVVSDVQGVLTDILLDIVPYPAMNTVTAVAQQPPMKDYTTPAGLQHHNPAAAGKGRLSRAMTLQQQQPHPMAGNPEAWRAVRQESISGGRPPPVSSALSLPAAANAGHSAGAHSNTTAPSESSNSRAVRPKRLNLRQCKNDCSRDYNSIDDLSPEYTVLPFVKRLKILNERQKIAELQRALTVVGGGGGSQNSVSGETAACANMVNMAKKGAKAAGGKETDAAVEAIQQQPENSNETPERVTLKKMLKSASRKELLEPQDQSHLKKLLRSQTVEGYAVRHANFTKLNQQRADAIRRIAQTLPSPPVVSIAHDDLIRFHPRSNDCVVIAQQQQQQEQQPPAIYQKQVELGTKEECVAELLTAIKTVLQDRLVIE